MNADEHLLQDSMDLDGISYKIHIDVQKLYLYLRCNVLTQRHALGRDILFGGLLRGSHHEYDEFLESQL